MPAKLAESLGLDEQDVAAAEAAADLLIEIYRALGGIRSLGWGADIASAAWSSERVKALYAKYTEHEKSFRSSERIIAYGLTSLVRLEMLTRDEEAEEEDLYFPTEKLLQLFSS